jgi:hypothetical protein
MPWQARHTNHQPISSFARQGQRRSQSDLFSTHTASDPMKKAPLAPTTNGSLRIVSLLRQGQNEPCRTLGQIGCALPSVYNTERGPTPELSGVRSSAYKLQAMCLVDSEIDRITRDAARHMRAQRYNPESTVRSIYRYVVEPAAIALASHCPNTDMPWFKRFPPSMRHEVAKRLSELVMANAMESLSASRLSHEGSMIEPLSYTA